MLQESEIDYEETISSIEENKENVTVIWFHSVQEEIRENLRAVNNRILCPDTIDQCIQEIESRKEDRIFLISERNNVNQLLSRMKDFSQLDSVFIYPKTGEELNGVDVDSTKIVGSFENGQDLIESIQQNTKRVNKEMEMISSFDQGQQSARDLSEGSAEFLWFQQLKYVIQESPHNDEAKNKMLEVSRQYYRDNQVMLQTIGKFERDYREQDCIWWYTRDTFVYRLVNRALRTADLEQLYDFRFYIADLSKQLAKRYELLKSTSAEKLVVYRGTRMPAKELEIYQDNIGKNIAINNYWSTSCNPTVAEVFAGSSDHLDKRVVRFEIECDIHDKNNSAIFCDISKDSQFPSEEEILFDAGSVLQIRNVERKSGDVYVIQMTTSGGQRIIETQYIDHIKEKMENESPRIMLGILLKKIGKYEKSLKYFQDLLKNPGEEKVAHIHNRIGIALMLRNEYDSALNHFNQAEELLTKLHSSERVYLAFIRHNQGQIHSRKNRRRALKCYQEAVKIIKKEICKPNRYLADIYTNIGRLHLYEKNLEQAWYYQTEASKIRNEYLPPDHVNHAFSYSEIANIFSAEGRYQQALEKHLQALELRQKYLLSNHLNTARSLHDVGKMYHKLLNAEMALDYYRQALKMKRKCLPDSRSYITPDILRDMALVHSYDSTEALKCLLEALDISLKGKPMKSFMLSRLLDDIVLVYKSLNRKKDLLEFYERALEIRKQFLFKDKVKLARLLDDIAYIYKQMNRIEDSLGFYKRALQIRQENLTNDSFDLSHSFRHLASLYERLDDMPSALYCYVELLKIYKYHYYYDHRRCVQTRQNIERIKSRMRPNIYSGTNYTLRNTNFH